MISNEEAREYSLAYFNTLAIGQIGLFIKIAIPFPFLIPCLIPPRDDREMTERRPHQLHTSKK